MSVSDHTLDLRGAGPETVQLALADTNAYRILVDSGTRWLELEATDADVTLAASGQPDAALTVGYTLAAGNRAPWTVEHDPAQPHRDSRVYVAASTAPATLTITPRRTRP